MRSQLFFWRECSLPSAHFIMIPKNIPLKYRNENSVHLGYQLIDLLIRCSFFVF